MRNRRIATIAGAVTGLAMLTGSVAYGTSTTTGTSPAHSTAAHAPGLLDNATAIYARLVAQYDTAVEAAKVAAAQAAAAQAAADQAAAAAAAQQAAADQAAAAAATADQAARDAAAALEAQPVDNPAPVDPTVDPANGDNDGDCGSHDGSRAADPGHVGDAGWGGFGGGHHGGHGHHGGGR